MNTARDTSTRPVVATGALAFGSALILASCATDTEGDADNAATDNIDPLLVSVEEDTFEAKGTVLQEGDEPAQLCNEVQQSLPPACSGIELESWDWDDVNHESEGDTRWGDFTVVGTYDGEIFSLTEEPREDEVGLPVEEDDGVTFTTPCPEPGDGWEPENLDLATDEALEEAMEVASERPEFAGKWIDQDDTTVEEDANDPETLIFNVRATENIDEIGDELREVWGGNLCVSEADYTYEELSDIQSNLEAELGDEFNNLGINEVENHVEAHVDVVSTEAQANFDEQYGEGAVNFEAWLEPVE